MKHPAVTARGLAEVLDVDAGPLERAIREGGKEQFVDAVALRPDDYARGCARSSTPSPAPLTAGVDRRWPPSRDVRPRAARRRRRRRPPSNSRSSAGASRPATRSASRASRARYRSGSAVAGAAGRDPRSRAACRSRRCCKRRPAARPRRCARRSTRGVQAAAEEALGDRHGRGGARGRPAVDRRHARRRQPPGRLDLRPRARRPLRARLDVQGGVDGGAAARRARRRPDRRRARGRIGRRRQAVQELRGQAPRARCRSPGLRAVRATPPSSRSPPAAGDALGRRRRATSASAASSSSGSRPPAPRSRRATDKVGRAAAMIGQDEIVASPLAMAGVAATVADGRWHAPRLLAGDPRKAGPALATRERDTLRGLMRAGRHRTAPARRSPASPARCAARAARPSSAAAIRRRPTRGSSPTATTSRSPCSSSSGRSRRVGRGAARRALLQRAQRTTELTTI